VKHFWCIYQITNKVNGKRYIGQHKYCNEENPLYDYWGSGKIIKLAIKKYGKKNFEKNVLYQRIKSLETANSMEIWAIEKYKPEYNIAKGGGGPTGCEPINKGVKGIFHHSEEARRKISEANKQRIVTEETKKKMSEIMKGRTPSKNTIEAVKKANIGRHHQGAVWTEEQRKAQSERIKGKHHSEETKKKMSEAMKGRKISEETKKKISESKKGHIISEETRRKISETLKRRNR
jgi:group I intron endonuclease